MWINLLNQILIIVIPPVAAALVAWIVVWVIKEWQALRTKYPQIGTWEDALKKYMPLFVSAAEQMRKAGLFPDPAQAKAWVINAAQSYLNSKGFSGINLDLIEASAETEVAKLPPFVPDAPTAPPEPVSTATVTLPPASMVEPAAPYVPPPPAPPAQG